LRKRILWMTLTIAFAAPAPRADARAAKRPLFGPALGWRFAQPKRRLAGYKATCSELRKKPAQPDSAALAKLAVPEHPGLHWGMTIAQARWVLARRKWPTRLGCYPTSANAYLTLRRQLSKTARGRPAAFWRATLRFQSSAPYGLYEIQMRVALWTKTSKQTRSQVDAVVKATLACYGPAPRRLPFPQFKIPIWEYKWKRGKTRIKLSYATVLTTFSNMSIRYSKK